jgi:hypothetical protein
MADRRSFLAGGPWTALKEASAGRSACRRFGPEIAQENDSLVPLCFAVAGWARDEARLGCQHRLKFSIVVVDEAIRGAKLSHTCQRCIHVPDRQHLHKAMLTTAATSQLTSN